MSRIVNDDRDGFAARVAKYVPSEVLAVYITIDNIFREMAAQAGAAANKIDGFLLGNGSGLLFLLCIVSIPALLKFQSDNDQEKRFVQGTIAIILFIVWVYCLKGAAFDKGVGFLNAVSLEAWHSPALSAILMALVTFGSGFFPNKSLSDLRPNGSAQGGGGG